MNSRPVRKAVFPVAGLGTRLLPATKSVPKEMLTIVDRPLIQYAVDEAREAGIEEMIFVTGRGKATLDDYFDIGFELETTMRERGKSLEETAMDLVVEDGSRVGTIYFLMSEDNVRRGVQLPWMSFGSDAGFVASRRAR